jgi:alpha-galactosidase
VKFDLFKRYGIIAAAGDRHLAEFVPNSWYLNDEDTLKKYMFSLTPVQWRKGEYTQQKNSESEQLVSGEKEFEINETGEDGVKIICALLGLESLVTNANMPNIGQIEGVPLDSVVETNVLVRRDDITPLYAGTLPDEVLTLVLPHVYNQRSIIEAGLKCDKQKAFNAFINDPLVNISLDEAKELFDRMLKNTAKYLPGWKL